jgi:glycosyltransferase involved in cell wall biosynthesis
MARPWPTISIVIPSYNYGRFLERAIRSVLSQSYPHKQLIVIDGASIDGTAAVLARYRDQLAVCISEPDAGQTDALNKGFRHVQGELFSWLNADDAFRPDAFAEVARLWRQGADLIGGVCCNIHEQEGRQELVAARETSFHRYLDFLSSGFRGFLPQPAVFASAAFATQAFPLQVGLRRAMDQQYFLRLLRQRPCQAFTQAVLVDFHYHGANLTTSEVPLLPELIEVSRLEVASLPWPQRFLQSARLNAILTLAHWLYGDMPTPILQLRSWVRQPLLGLHPLSWRFMAKRLLMKTQR